MARTATLDVPILYRRAPLYTKQEEALFHDARYGCVEASTKAGKTVGCLVWITEQACLNGGEGRNFWWVAPIRDQAKIAFRRLKRFLPRGTWTSNEAEQTVTLLNGSVIWFKSAVEPDSLYGEDVYAAVIDEASRCSSASWLAVRTTLTATKGPVRIIGNVKGSKNWAYRMARRAENGAPNMEFHRLTVWDAVDAGIFSMEEAEDARSHMTSAEFQELYLAMAADEGDQFFHVEDLAVVEDWPRHARVARAWDLATTKKRKGADPDYTVGAKLAWDGKLVYIVDIVRFRESPDRVIEKITETAITDGRTCDQVFEEEKGSSGKTMIELFRVHFREQNANVGRIHPAPITGGKRARAFHFAGRVNDGNVRLVQAPWNDTLIAEFDDFTGEDDIHDDVVDSASHAYNFLVPKGAMVSSRTYVPGFTQ